MDNLKDCGFIYCATRNRAYQKLALQSAASLRRQVPNAKITLFTDNLIPDVAHDVFTNIIPMTSKRFVSIDWANGLIDKVRAINYSRYQYSFFIDCGTLIVNAEIIDAFELLKQYHILITECAADASYSRRLFSKGLYSSGILGFQKNALVQKMLKQWLTLTCEYVQASGEQHLGEFDDLSSLTTQEKQFMLMTDQYSLSKLLTPAHNPLSLKVKVLEERWNFQGDGERLPPKDLIVDHQLKIKKA